MSKNYTNYNKMTMPELVEEVEATVGLVETEEAKELTEEIKAQPALTIEEIAELEPEVAPPAEPIDGVVTAVRLNVRKLPSANAAVVTVINQDTKVQINTEESTSDWYKVYTAAGVEGYCMKKFIEVK